MHSLSLYANIEDLQKRLAVAELLLKEWAEIHPDPCRTDHHGYCQEHYVQEDCIVKRTKEFLGTGE